MMNEALSSDLFLGFDPGGEDGFGVAAICDAKVSVAHVSSIKEAVEWTLVTCGDMKPTAAGIDTILHWSADLGGNRNADRWLRKKYPLASTSVISPNSLRGAMTLGGVGLAIELRKRWPTLILNETHPKVLYHALTKQPYPRESPASASEWLACYAKFVLRHPITSDDEFDAILSAWATREALDNRWVDLAVADVNHIYPINNVRYFWPESN